MNIIEEIEKLIFNKIGVFKSLYSLIKHEAQLAGLSVVPLAMTLFCLFIVLMSSWLVATALLGYCIYLMTDNSLISILLVFLFNISILFVLTKYLVFNLKNMSFEKTREYFSKGDENEAIKRKINRRHRKNRQNLTLPQ